MKCKTWGERPDAMAARLALSMGPLIINPTFPISTLQGLP